MQLFRAVFDLNPFVLTQGRETNKEMILVRHAYLSSETKVSFLHVKIKWMIRQIDS